MGEGNTTQEQVDDLHFATEAGERGGEWQIPDFTLLQHHNQHNHHCYRPSYGYYVCEATLGYIEGSCTVT